MAGPRQASSSSSSGATSSSPPARRTATDGSGSSQTSPPGRTGWSSIRRLRSSPASSSSSSSATATITCRCSSPRTRARRTAEVDGRRARGAVQRADALRREARAGGRPARPRARRRARAERGREGRGACGASAHRRALARATRRRPCRPLGARRAQPRIRGALRLSLRRLRERPLARRDPAGAARQAREHAGAGARHRAGCARLDRRGPMAQVLSPYATEWLDLVFRWFHVIAAIVWIGTSFYFVALDNHLEPAEGRDDLAGDTWEIHGGGFYRIEKYRVAPQRLPEPLHWFKWEAYWTWLSGFTLFVVLYYFHAHATLIDSAVANLTTLETVGASIGLLIAAWVLYDALCPTVGRRSELALAGHFPFTYRHAHNWAILICLFVGGVAIRHYFNRRHAGRTLWWIPVACALAVAGLAVWIRPASVPASTTTVSFSRIQPIMQRRCAYCHSLHPQSTAYTTAPQGIRFDTPQEIAAQAALIEAVAVQSHTMLLNNETNMTDAERRLLGAWIAQGAKIK